MNVRYFLETDGGRVRIFSGSGANVRDYQKEDAINHIVGRVRGRKREGGCGAALIQVTTHLDHRE
jgi:hypothetical protein